MDAAALHTLRCAPPRRVEAMSFAGDYMRSAQDAGSRRRRNAIERLHAHRPACRPRIARNDEKCSSQRRATLRAAAFRLPRYALPQHWATIASLLRAAR